MLLYLAIAMLVVVVAVIALGSRNKPQVQRSDKPQANESLASSVPPPKAPVRTWPPLPAAEIPAELAGLQIVRHTSLPQQQVEALVDKLQNIPRPPQALDKLVSAEFLAQASSAELNDLMLGEPQIAAKVLASVNSPIYGLQKPLGSIGQAATYLGMNTVRGICLQYMLDASFKPADPQIKARYADLWNASAFSSELCFKLAQLLRLQEPGNLVTQVVLSYLGPLASYSLLDKDTVLSLARSNAIERIRIEQDKLGICAAEVGSLLMQSWKLPPSVIADVRDIDQILVSPRLPQGDARGARLALCYVCNRLGALLATGALTDLRNFSLQSGQIELHFLQGYLGHPSLERLGEFLLFPEVLNAASQMAAAVQMGRSHRGP